MIEVLYLLIVANAPIILYLSIIKAIMLGGD